MKKLPPQPNLFDVIDVEEAKEQVAAGKVCTHPVMYATETVWPGDTELRMTMTCESCGFVRPWYFEPRRPRTTSW